MLIINAALLLDIIILVRLDLQNWAKSSSYHFIASRLNEFIEKQKVKSLSETFKIYIRNPKKQEAQLLSLGYKLLL